MAEVRWTPQASGDLEAITNFIAADSPHYAGLFAMTFWPLSNDLRPSRTPAGWFPN